MEQRFFGVIYVDLEVINDALTSCLLLSCLHLAPHSAHIPPPPRSGPVVPWRPGRTDKPSGEACPPNGRLPNASLGAPHIRDIFSRMGFNDQEMVALIGEERWKYG